MTNNPYIRTEYLLFFLAFSISNIWAGQTGKITGRVIDASNNEIIVGTNVFIEGTNFGAATDLEGDFVILNIPPGIYTLTAAMIGYKELKITNVNVSTDRTTKVDIKMQPVILIGEVIYVEAEQPLIQKDLTATEASVSAQEIKSIPVESLQDVLQLQAGIIVDSRGDFHIRGGRASEIAYMVDGVSVSDPFSGRIAVNVNQEAIQELKVISGTFNAEYGRVMSGVVEVVTKEPEDEFTFGVNLYSGDYVSSHTNLFYNIDELDPTDLYNSQIYFTGPFSIISNKLSYYVSLRKFYNDGWIYGQRRFMTYDSSNFEGNTIYLEETGDNKPVAMNSSSQYYGNIKLIYKIIPSMKLTYSFLGNYNAYRFYDHLYKYDPDGNINNFEYGYTHIINFNHTLSANTFYTINLSNYYYDLKSYLYKDLYDPRYQNPELLRNREDAFSFLTGGTNMSHFYRNTTVNVAKFDITSQVTKKHQLKSGIEIKANIIYVRSDEARYKGKQSEIFSSSTFFNLGSYSHDPLEISAYFQDKIELANMTLNLGFRYDYFNSNGKIPTDLRDPQNAYALPSAYENSKSLHQFSPRFGIAFPISASGIIHSSYGHFFQIPPFEYLYVNPRFAVAPGGLSTLMGNANLKPQSTVIYEVGLQQQLLEQIGIDVTGFYKDARNLLGTRIYETYVLGDRYARYENRNYGNIRGITLSINKRPNSYDYLTVSFDYTFQVAEGDASDPNHVFVNSQSDPPKQSNIQVVPLDWDQTHTVNLSISYNNPNLIGLGLIGQFQSGLPYTPAIQSMETTFENSGRKPFNYNIDFRISKEFEIWKNKVNVFLKVYNLFDRKNEITVYDDTGRADYSLVSHYLGVRRGYVNTLEDWLNRPDYYSEPRKVLIGFDITL